MSANRGMDKENIAYLYIEILFSFKNEGDLAICNNMDELGGYYAK